MKNKVIIVGAFHEIIELAEANGLEICGLIDKQKSGNYRKYKILFDDTGAIKRSLDLIDYPLILTPDLPTVRRKLFDLYSENSFQFFTLISNKTEISKSAKIGRGSVIQNGVNISAEVNIGDFVKVNTNANIMHNSSVGDFTTIAPNAVVLGNVQIGNNCYLGANSTILPNLEICDNVLIGAGAVVTKNISIKGTYAGVPIKLLSK